MTASFIISIAGTPRPQPRPRFVRGQRHPVSTADPKAKLWRLAIERGLNGVLEGRPRPIFNGAVKVTLTFSYETAIASDIGRHIQRRADVDNLSKLALDVMERAGMFKNDRQVAELEAVKLWAVMPGLVIEVQSLELAEPRTVGPVATRPDWL